MITKRLIFRFLWGTHNKFNHFYFFFFFFPEEPTNSFIAIRNKFKLGQAPFTTPDWITNRLVGFIDNFIAEKRIQNSTLRTLRAQQREWPAVWRPPFAENNHVSSSPSATAAVAPHFTFPSESRFANLGHSDRITNNCKHLPAVAVVAVFTAIDDHASALPFTLPTMQPAAS